MPRRTAGKKLKTGAILKEGIAIGAKNIGPILVNILLWFVTVWIPYLNVGTTIGLMVGIVSKASNGQIIPVTEVFDPKYRKYMGEYFLTSGLIGLGVGVGLVFFIIPGIVIGIAWSLSLLLVIDKGKNPTEAITLSNNLTYGHKGKIFGIYFIICFLLSAVTAILMGIGSQSYNTQVIFCMSLISLLVSLFGIFVMIGVQASIYKQLAGSI